MLASPKPKFRIPLDTFIECWIGAFKNQEAPQTLQEMTAHLSTVCSRLEVNAEYVKAHGPKEIKTSAVHAKMNYYIKSWGVKIKKPKSVRQKKRENTKKLWVGLFEQANLIDI